MDGAAAWKTAKQGEEAAMMESKRTRLRGATREAQGGTRDATSSSGLRPGCCRIMADMVRASFRRQHGVYKAQRRAPVFDSLEENCIPRMPAAATPDQSETMEICSFRPLCPAAAAGLPWGLERRRPVRTRPPVRAESSGVAGTSGGPRARRGVAFQKITPPSPWKRLALARLASREGQLPKYPPPRKERTPDLAAAKAPRPTR